MPFKNITETPSISLPIRGKTYVVESPDAATGLLTQTMASAAAALRAGLLTRADLEHDVVLDDDDERDLYIRLLGDTYDQLCADGVAWHLVRRAGMATMLWVVQGEAAAEAFWNSDTDGEGDTDPKGPESTANAAPPA